MSFRDYLTRLPADPESTVRARAHWQARLPELPPPPALPFDRDPATLDAPVFTRRRLSLPAGDWQAVKRDAARHGLTPSTVLLALYAEVLAAWSGADAVTVTLTLFNRRDVHPHIHRVLGDFTSLSLVGYRREGADWPAAAAELQRRQAEDLDHADVPIDWLLREFGRRTGTVDAAAPVVFTSAIGVGDATLAGPGTGLPEGLGHLPVAAGLPGQPGHRGIREPRRHLGRRRGTVRRGCAGRDVLRVRTAAAAPRGR